MVFRELSFSRLECGVHDRLHIYPLCGIFYFPWHRHRIEGTNGFYCLIRKTERFTISNVESQVFTPTNSRLDPGSNPGCPRDKRMSYHWTSCASQVVFYKLRIIGNSSDGSAICCIIGGQHRAVLTEERNHEQLADNFRADHPDFTVCNNIIRYVYRAELILGR